MTLPGAKAESGKKAGQLQGGIIMEKLINGIKGLDSIWRRPDVLKGPRIPKTGDVLNDIAILGAIWVLMKVLAGDRFR